MILGLLDANGPMHGYRVRAIAERTQAEGWAGVSLGSLHRELRTMEQAGLVDPVRSEKVANRPPRTIYRITDEGRQVLRQLREEAICSLDDAPDRLGVALMFGRIGDAETLTKLLETRHAALTTHRDAIREERLRLIGAGHITPFDAAMFVRHEMRITAELEWLDAHGRQLATLPATLTAAAEAADKAEEE